MEYQCYFTDENGDRCKNRQNDCWCSEPHRIAWQEATYGTARPKENRRLTIQEMQKGLKEMEIAQRKKAHIKPEQKTMF